MVQVLKELLVKEGMLTNHHMINHLLVYSTLSIYQLSTFSLLEPKIKLNTWCVEKDNMQIVDIKIRFTILKVRTFSIVYPNLADLSMWSLIGSFANVMHD